MSELPKGQAHSKRVHGWQLQKVRKKAQLFVA